MGAWLWFTFATAKASQFNKVYWAASYALLRGAAFSMFSRNENIQLNPSLTDEIQMNLDEISFEMKSCKAGMQRNIKG